MPGMQFIVWKNEFSVGREELDAQHKKIFDAINELYDALREEQGASVAGRILLDLQEYTKTHFREEERYMRECNYPDYESHKKIHDALMQKTNDISRQFNNSYEIMPLEVFEYLKRWWKNHICAADHKYAPFLR